MPKFRKKPVVIEAWCGGRPRLEKNLFGTRLVLDIPTLEGTMQAEVGDWIIRGVAGEFYACKPDIFETTYEPVEEGQ